ncbi:MAG TPA: alkaline phosphatase family protein [Solirubrobacteraceae bacterium]|nr:alkaline phosphatase family protein [Solirubrobacteraceae bacterium]
MPSNRVHAPTLAPNGEPCAACGTALAGDQRYCLECGARRGAPRLDPVALARGEAAPYPSAPDGVVAVPPGGDPALPAAAIALGRPRVAAIASLLVLGFGVIVGVAAGPDSSSSQAAQRRIVVAQAPAATTAPAAPAPTDSGTSSAATSTSGDASSSSSDSGAVTDTSVTPVDTSLTTDSGTGTGSGGGTSGSGSGTGTSGSGTSGSGTGTGDTTGTGTSTPTSGAAPAPVKHVWLIPLTGQTVDTAFPAQPTDDPYLDGELAGQGTLLTGYSSIAPGSLANAIALISGQGPTTSTLAECPTYTDVKPGTIAKKTGLVSGDGCVYPAKVVTLADQLTGAGLTWKGYFEDMGAGPPSDATSCRRPPAGAADPYAAARPGDAYLTRRDPFVYFHSIADTADCGSNVVGLDRLAPDLQSVDNTPAFSYVVPNACHDGDSTPCADGAPAGLAAADAWLKTVVPEIQASKAYADGGLIVILFDGQPPAPAAPATPAAPAGVATTARAHARAADAAPATAKVGALLLSQYVPGGVKIATAYDHYSLLRTIEAFFGLDALGHAADKTTKSVAAKVFANAPVAGSD